LEEDIALANLGLDLIGQARSFLYYAGNVESKGRDEDQLAYHRNAPEYRNLLLVELPKGDFAFTMVRQFLFSAFQLPLFRALMQSKDKSIAAIAAKAEKEMIYHLRHSSQWVVRLGDGTDESHTRCQNALDSLWAYTGEMFETNDALNSMIDEGVYCAPETLRDDWNQTIDDVLSQATLNRPESGWMQSGGSIGRHTEHMGHLLADMQSVPRAFPGSSW
jgi:ring-1,2-phenylacetyl-CoA epoxidase subunit PaaC